MRLPILLLAGVLFSGSAEAAEQAWVLWVKYDNLILNNPRLTRVWWEIVGATETKRECDQWAQGVFRVHQESNAKTVRETRERGLKREAKGDFPLSILELYDAAGEWEGAFKKQVVCLPGTIDPRDK